MPELGGPIAKRNLPFFILADCSHSMEGSKIESVNQGIRDALPEIRRVAQDNPGANVLISVLKFSDGAYWHGAKNQPVETFELTENLTVTGLTQMGLALEKVADELQSLPRETRLLPPVILLMSDGQPTDDFNGGLKKLLNEPWGKKAVKIAIAIGDDADKGVLQKFIDNAEIPVLQADNAQQLVNRIKWASTVPIKVASNPHMGSNPLSNPPEDVVSAGVDDDLTW